VRRTTLVSWLDLYRLFLLDFDGLLVDTEPLHFAAYRQMCADRGFALAWDFETYCLSAHYGSERLRANLLAAVPGLERAEPRWATLYSEKSRAYLDLARRQGVELRPGAERFLVQLEAAGVERAVVTNSSREQVEALRSQLPALDLVSEWITREDYEAAKPAPDAYQRALARCGRAPAAAIGFEDTPRGLRSLLAAGVHGVLVTTVPYPELDELRALGTSHLSSLEEALGPAG